MRNLILSVFVLLTINVHSAKTKVIERPPFSVWNSTTIEIEKIVLSDTATVLFIKAFFYPNQWIRIDTETYLRVNGEKVKMQKSEGIPLDTECYMDSTGQKRFSLIFPPIDPTTQQIDFIESDCDNCFKIWGVELNSKKLSKRVEVPKEVKATAVVNMKENGQLETPSFKSEPAILKGQFLGYVPEMNFKVQVFVNNPIIGEQEEYKSDVNSDGSFEIKVPLVCDMQVLLRNNIYYKYILLSPGKESLVYFDLQQQCMQESRLRADKSKAKDIIYFGGAWAEINNQLSRSEILQFNINSQAKDIVGMNAGQYKAYVLNNMDESIKKLDAAGLSPKALAFAKLFCQYGSMYQLFLASHYLESAFRHVNNLNYEQELTGYVRPVCDEEYFSFLRDFPVNDPVSLYSQNYGNLINSSKYVLSEQSGRRITLNYLKEEVIRSLMQTQQLANEEKEVAEFLIMEEYGNWGEARIADYKKSFQHYIDTLKTLVKLTDSDKAEIEKLQQLVSTDGSKVIDLINTRLELVELYLKKNPELPQEMLIAFEPGKPVTDSISIAVSGRINGFIEKYKGQISEIEKNVRELVMMKPLANLLGTNKGLAFDLMYTHSKCEGLEKYSPLSENDLKSIALMDNPFYAEYISFKNDELIKRIEANKGKGGFTIHDTPETANDSLFVSLLKPFAGKVVLVDFWATWCGPCRMAMKEMEPAKKKYEGKDVVFVYVTDESSPLATWQNMIPDIHGEHYRLKQEQFVYLRDKFGARGVPSYMVINKSGEQVYFQVGFEGAYKICGLIDDELNKL